MTKVSLRFAPYAGTRCEWREVDAKVVGDLAVHRPGYIRPEREGGELSILKKCWTVSHIPTGDIVESAMPARFKDRGAIIANQRDLAAWAEAWQAACPEFFRIAANGGRPGGALARDALDKGRAL